MCASWLRFTGPPHKPNLKVNAGFWYSFHTMPDDKYLKEIFQGPVREGERVLLEGTLGRDVVSFVRDMKGGPRVTIHHLDQFFSIAAKIANVGRSIAWGESQDAGFEGEYLTPGSYVNRSSIIVSQAPRLGKNLYTLENLYASATPNGMLAIVRPYPIQWHLDHIDDRSKERRGGFNAQDDRFRLHNNVVMMMLQIIEEEHYTGETPYIPFILPESNGVLLGHTMSVRSGMDGNRIFMAAAKNHEVLNLGRYAHFPQLEATVRTFLGPDEMTPAIKQLRLQLLKYYAPPYKDALAMGMDMYVRTVGSAAYEDHPQRDRFEDALIGISDIMASPLWQKNVRLPAHLRGGKGLIIDHP